MDQRAAQAGHPAKDIQPTFELRQLQTFVAVATSGSFSAAARSLGLTQGSVSQQVAALERALGVGLLDRLPRHIEPTAAGELLLGRAREMLALREVTLAELDGLLGVCRGRVIIGASSTPAEQLLPGLLQRFNADYPEVTTVVKISGSAVVADQVLAGEVAFGVVGARRPDDRLRYLVGWTDELILVVGPSHPWASRRSPVTAAQLGSARWVRRELESGTRREADRMIEEQLALDPAAFHVAAELGSATAVREAVRAGLGIAIVSGRSVVADIASGRLARVKVKRLRCAREIFVVRDGLRTLPPPARALHDFVLRCAESVRSPSLRR